MTQHTETADAIRKYASASPSAAAPKAILRALLGNPHSVTSNNPVIKTHRAANDEIYARLLGALSGGYHGATAATSDNWLTDVTGVNLSDNISKLSPLPRALAIAALTTAGAATGSRLGGATSAGKHLLIDKIKPIIQQHPDYSGLFLDALGV